MHNSQASTLAADDTPTALVLGGTSGIGESIVRALWNKNEGHIRIIISGRNEEAAKAIINSLPVLDRNSPPSDGAGVEFVKCDASLMGNVHDLARTLHSKMSVESLNWLILTPGCLSLCAWEETSDGIDRKLALAYYCRFLLITLLLPQLHQARRSGQQASVLSVCAAGTNETVDLDDLGMKKASMQWEGRFGWLKKEQQAGVAYNDLMIETFADENPGILFIHMYPGMVRTPITRELPSIQRKLFDLMFIAFSSDANKVGYQIVEKVLCSNLSEGALFLGSKGQKLGGNKWSNDESRAKLKNHSELITKVG